MFLVSLQERNLDPRSLRGHKDKNQSRLQSVRQLLLLEVVRASPQSRSRELQSL